MDSKKFRKLLFIEITVLALLTAALAVYTVCAYLDCSIISFIGGEVW